VIEIKGLTKNYSIDRQIFKAVDNVYLSVKKGEMVSIIGHSGSGKTTLLSLIGGLTKPDAGQVLIDDADIWSMNDSALSRLRNKKISFIYQFASLIPTLSALDNIMLPTSFGEETGDNIRGRAEELLRLVGLKEKSGAYPAHLSGGQQRRIAIARAFINSPEIILADEPTGDLDEETEDEIIRLFQDMSEKKNMTFIIVTHNKEIAARARRQLSMSNGVLIEK
jgi:putative ABC transport system ATP-binding protein/lipoprotein-releasing system ATP-binding protein